MNLLFKTQPHVFPWWWIKDMVVVHEIVQHIANIKVLAWLLVQDGRVEEHALISSHKSNEIASTWWTTIQRRTLEPTRKGCPRCKHKEETTMKCKRRSSTIKINPIPGRWETNKLENDNTKKNSPTGVEVLSLMSCFQACKGTGNPQGIWLWRPVGFDSLTSTGLWERLSYQGPNKVVHAPRPRGMEQWPHRGLNQT